MNKIKVLPKECPTCKGEYNFLNFQYNMIECSKGYFKAIPNRRVSKSVDELLELFSSYNVNLDKGIIVCDKFKFLPYGEIRIPIQKHDDAAKLLEEITSLLQANK